VSDWSIELFKNQIELKILSEKFSNSFPQRKKTFFERIIYLLDDTNSRLFLLVIDGEVKGATFAFRIYGYDFEVWSPSYLYVEKGHRDVSLFFIIGVLKKISINIIDVSPTVEVRKILSAVKYKEFTKGSFLIPALRGVFNFFPKRQLIICSSPIELFSRRKDLIWLNSKEDNCFFCIKITSRFGIKFFVLVYFNKIHFAAHIKELLCRVANINPLGILIIPNLGGKSDFLSFQSEKFHSFSNITNSGDIYSILGSEVTEAI
jgi:hypothetical protein